MSQVKFVSRKKVGDKEFYNNSQRSPKKIVSEPSYTTNGEDFILVKGIEKSHVILNNSNTEHIIIKSLTNVVISCTENKIDEEYQEIIIGKGACVEFYLLENNWYIVSSDGLKLDQF